MKKILLLLLAAGAVAAVALLRGPAPHASSASSHREAPLISDDPTADNTDLYVLLPHTSVESLALFSGRLADDKAFQLAGEAIIRAPKSDPAFLRYESSLMVSFDGFPQVKVPTQAATRLLQLRIYESHSNERNKKKVQMFHEGGELEIFKRCGMNGVFFGLAQDFVTLNQLIERFLQTGAIERAFEKNCDLRRSALSVSVPMLPLLWRETKTCCSWHF